MEGIKSAFPLKLMTLAIWHGWPLSSRLTTSWPFQSARYTPGFLGKECLQSGVQQEPFRPLRSAMPMNSFVRQAETPSEHCLSSYSRSGLPQRQMHLTLIALPLKMGALRVVNRTSEGGDHEDFFKGENRAGVVHPLFRSLFQPRRTPTTTIRPVLAKCDPFGMGLPRRCRG